MIVFIPNLHSLKPMNAKPLSSLGFMSHFRNVLILLLAAITATYQPYLQIVVSSVVNLIKGSSASRPISIKTQIAVHERFVSKCSEKLAF